MTLRVIRVFTAAFPDRAFGNADSCRSGSAGALAIAIEYSLLRWKKRLKGRAVAQPRCSDSHCLEKANPLRARASTGIALRTRADLKLRNLAKIEATLWWKTIRDVRFLVG